jgi:hypothetical protein
MTGKAYAEFFLREYAGGNISDDVEITLFDIYPAIDNALQDTLPMLPEINGAWVKPYECQDLKKDCVCGQQVYYVDVPVPILQLPKDGGIVNVCNTKSNNYSYAAINDLGNILGLELQTAIYWVKPSPDNPTLTRIFTNKSDKIHYYILPITRYADVAAIPSGGYADKVDMFVRRKLGMFNNTTDINNDASQKRTIIIKQ